VRIARPRVRGAPAVSTSQSVQTGAAQDGAAPQQLKAHCRVAAQTDIPASHRSADALNERAVAKYVPLKSTVPELIVAAYFLLFTRADSLPNAFPAFRHNRAIHGRRNPITTTQ